MKRGWRFLAGAIMCVALWTARTEEEAHYRPDYEMADLSVLLGKKALTRADYELLYRQTGLARQGVDELFEQGRQHELSALQKRFFEPVEYECVCSNVICRSERLLGEEREGDFRRFLPTARTGDILITFSGHVFGWRSGHAAMVVDGEEGMTLEAVTLGCDSRLCSLEHWLEYPCFALMRLKDVTGEEAEEIAAYARENLAGISYDLASLTYGDEPEALAGTQCAHLVWAAYYHFGYDLDSDGGLLVTPHDLYKSELLEVVQLYGLSQW